MPVKSCLNRCLNATWKLCAAAVLCAAVGVSAQTVHRQTDGDGRITYTDRLEAKSPPQAGGAAQSDVAGALARQSPMTSKAAATIDFNEANRRLLRAKQSRLEALAPRPGEHASVSLLNERYLRDLPRLNREVAAAQRRSNETSLIRSALLRSDVRNDPPDLAHR